MSGDSEWTRIGPGRLVAVVGPSGAGKDTLIRAARDRLAADPRYVFPRRIITRAPSASEDNVEVDPARFEEWAGAGRFAADWSAHGMSYGLPASIDAALAEGRTVICNVSRTIVADLRARYESVLVVEISAPPEVLSARLAARGRAEDGDIGSRVRRSSGIAGDPPDVVISNVGDLNDALAAFRAAIAADTRERGREPADSPS